MYYKYEMHAHDSACSACGYDTAENMIDAAIEKGLSGIVFTNHFYHGNTCVDRSLPWYDFVMAFDEDFRRAKAYGDSKDFDVIFGIEEAYRDGHEILIYGIDAEVIANCPEFHYMKIREMSDFIRKNGGLVAAAHPFRHRDYIPDPENFDGEEFFDAVEIFNLQNLETDNAMAEDYFKNSGILRISGSDIHGGNDFGKAGLAFPHRISDTHDLVKCLKDRSFKLIINGELFGSPVNKK